MKGYRAGGVLALLLSATLAYADSPAQAALARFKALAGEWQATGQKGNKMRMRYTVIGGGSAVEEHFTDDSMGADHETVTIYYVEGEHLALRHYCMVGNQPHMQARGVDEAGTVQFEFVDATGMSSPNAGHMHRAAFHFTDANHLSTEWNYVEGGETKFTENVQYTRVR
jgi:hypothetical protein